MLRRGPCGYLLQKSHPWLAKLVNACRKIRNIQKRNGYFIQGDDVVTWVVGHVLHQAEPGDYDDKYIRWRPQDLPIVPDEWKLLVTDSSRQQFETVKDLIGKADIIVNAGDPDREGQLLVDEVLYYVGNTKPVQRILLMRSMKNLFVLLLMIYEIIRTFIIYINRHWQELVQIGLSV